MMARPAWVVASTLSPRRGRRIVLAAGALTAWDVFLDPRMAREQLLELARRRTLRGRAGEQFRGLVRAAPGWRWFGAYSPARPTAAPRTKAALALYVWTWLGEVFANAALWERPRVAVTGGWRWERSPSPR